MVGEPKINRRDIYIEKREEEQREGERRDIRRKEENCKDGTSY
jgi:hypothetical protein